VPAELRPFNERWRAQRGFREGFLMALVQKTERISHPSSRGPSYLQVVARRAGLEFASELVSPSAAEDSESIEGLAQRAQRITSTLFQILQRSRPPTHGGINE
jgi:hypothetical protein